MSSATDTAPVKERLFTVANQYFEGLLTDIAHAQKSIDMEVYIFAEDAIGQRLISALCAAAERGVSVRLLVDGAGSPWTITALLQQLRKAGGEARVYHPMPWRFWQWALAANRYALPLRLMHFFSWVNRRNHRKVTMIDHRIAWLGSLNITADHLALDEGGKGWRDTALRVQSKNCVELKRAFLQAWQHPSVKPSRAKKPVSGQFMLNYSRYLRRMQHKRVLRHIGRSKQRIWVTNAYFMPDAKLLRGLRYAAKRGVDVRLMLPAHSDIFFMPWASSHFYRELLEDGVRIFEYQTGMLHAKTLLIDHWGTVGSSNLNQRSLRHDLEVDAVLTCKDNVETLSKHFQNDLKHAKEVGRGGYIKLALWKRLIGRVALLLRYWM
ncbi:cardiolipin synthetase [gamma proteobacterium HTCC5015]|nr:cardiolipin synthetase [gamma proteobacterium HTCC5015]